MKKKSFKLLSLNKKLISNFKMSTISGGSTLHCVTINTLIGNTCDSCRCNKHTTDPGEMGPCTETIR